MSSSKLPNIASLRKQQLRLEFATLQTAPPTGVYVSLSPTDPTLWSGVLFVQKGPYASAILRFKIRFPSTYPDLPPLVTFSTDIFHPLLVPLTTYTYTTGSSSDTDTVSATDEERLPPGGFSLRHGFPHWFGRAKRSAPNSAASSRNVSSNQPVDVVSNNGTNEEHNKDDTQGPESIKGGDLETPTASNTLNNEPQRVEGGCYENDEQKRINAGARISPLPSRVVYSRTQFGADVPVVELLDYIRSTFDDESVLDSVPMEAAGNPGAWHAWRAHRRNSSNSASKEGGPVKEGSRPTTSAAGRTLSPDSKPTKGSPQTRQPGEWNWEGVWAKRVQTGIQTSYLESVLFGSSSRDKGIGDDLIRFQKLDNEILTNIKDDIIATRDELGI